MMYRVVHRWGKGPVTALSSLIVLAAACEPPAEAPPPATPVAPAPTATETAGPKVVEKSMEDVGLDSAALDRSIDPCQDFYQFACGNWLAKTQIPADKPAWSRSFSVISDRNEGLLRQILEDAAAGKTTDDLSKKIGTYYGACMDEAAVEAAKTKPLDPLFKLIKSVKDAKTLSKVVTELHRRKIWALFDISDTQDAKDATRVIAEIDQSGLGLPDRDYYVKDDDKSKDIRKKYEAHVERMLKLAGLSAKDATKATEDVMRIETALANASKTRVERRDPNAMYNRLDRAGVIKKAPSMLWEEYFKGIGFPALKEINVTAPGFLEKMSQLMGDEKAPAWRNYLTWVVVRSTAPLLPKAFVDESFAFESSLTGQKEQRARWKRCVAATDAALGELVAQPYVKDNFSPESLEATQRYVKEIAQVFGGEVEKLDWMDKATKQKAKEKLDAMAYLIGYPKKWRSYEFDVKAKSLLENALAARTSDLKRHLDKVGKPVDREAWQMTPPTVNAYYDPQLNQMVFPAGILQPPFFSPKASIPVNLGGMGMVVGHELTHGFDDQGAQFDAKGNLANWWSDQDVARFKGKTDCVSDQYGGYETLPGVKLNGKLTLGENIADGGGVKLAFHAYRAMRKDAPEVVKAGGFTEDQQFFLGVGQAWCFKQSDEMARLRAQVDPHSPARFRVNGPLSNSPEFAEAFSCKAGTPMHRENACKVW
ncbi:Metallopeptidase [Minicystis rosea]|nr:Metallopeptidase [Minicystis rosea]